VSAVTTAISAAVAPVTHYVYAAIIGALLAGFGWYTYHERSVEHAKDVAHAAALVQAQKVNNEQVESRAKDLAQDTIDAYKQTLAAAPQHPDAGVVCIAAARRAVPGAGSAGPAPTATEPVPGVHK
jgi:hypothetical protein